MNQLNYENYFSNEMNQKYMGVTQFKGFVPQLGGCEAKSMAILNEVWEDDQSEAMLQGSYFHAWNEGRLDEFIAKNEKRVIKKGGEKYKFIADVDEVIEFVKEDAFFMEAISGKKEVIFTFNLGGIEWKSMIDSHYPTAKFPRFTDLKLLASIDESSKQSKIWDSHAQCYRHVLDAYGYLLQMGIYTYGEAQLMGRKQGEYARPHLAIATKEKPYPDKAIIVFESNVKSLEDFVNEQMAIVNAFLPRVIAVKHGGEPPHRCGHCDYCRATHRIEGVYYYEHYTNIYGDK